MNLLTLEDEKFKTVVIEKKYKFKIKYISPLDRIAITQRRTSFQNGKPIDSFTQDEFDFFENIAIVDTCTEEFPEEFNDLQSCAKWPDIDVINGLAYEIRVHTNDILSKLKKNRLDVGSSE